MSIKAAKTASLWALGSAAVSFVISVACDSDRDKSVAAASATVNGVIAFGLVYAAERQDEMLDDVLRDIVKKGKDIDETMRPQWRGREV